MSKTTLALAGLSDLNGELGRPVPTAQIIVPEKIWLQDHRIHWVRGQKPREQEVSRTMINQFIRLRDDESVLDFAQEWGVLSLSETVWRFPKPRGYIYRPGCQSMHQGVEPVSAWKYYSRRAEALLNVASALKMGKLGDMGDWGEFCYFFSHAGQFEQVNDWLKQGLDRHGFGMRFSVLRSDGTYAERIAGARRAAADEVNEWLNCWREHDGIRSVAESHQSVSDFGMRWVEDQKRWNLQIDFHGLLFPAVALQLALVVADADSLYTCSGCGIPYIRPRERKKPKAGYANYCKQCTDDGEAERRAVETYRKKRAKAVRLHEGGSSVSEIAEQLNADPARISAWLEKGGEGAKKKARKR